MSVKVLTKIGTVKFFERKNSFKVKCKGESSFVIRKAEGGKSFEATEVLGLKGVSTVVAGRTAESCYRKAVNTFWM
jgi:hypothetical protein